VASGGLITLVAERPWQQVLEEQTFEELSAAPDPYFLERILEVTLYGVLGDVQRLGYLSGREAAGHQPDDVLFPAA
jgi:hypothetical protein